MVEDHLYDEIRESQKSRFSLLKWKILIIATLVSSSLGFSSKNSSNDSLSVLILCFIPFVCCYIDALHRHYYLRGKINGIYLRHAESDSSHFEKFIDQLSKNISLGTLESNSVIFSSIGFSILSIISGLYISDELILSLLVSTCGTLGVLLSFLIESIHKRKINALEEHTLSIISSLQEAQSE